MNSESQVVHNKSIGSGKKKKKLDRFEKEDKIVLSNRNKLLEERNKFLEKEVQRTQNRLHDSEEKYKHLVESANDIIFTTDELGYFTYVNSIAIEKFGYCVEDIIGARFTDFIPAENIQEVFDFYARVRIQKIKTSYLEFPVYTASGEIIWIGQNVNFVKQADGTRYYMAVARDITEKKEAETLFLRKKEFHQCIMYFASSLQGSNSIKNILNDICYTCISRLNFEDCTVYLLDEKSGKLIHASSLQSSQKDRKENFAPLEIELGKGIAGYVAGSGIPEILNELSKDNRYIYTDRPEGSGIIVPIKYEDRVLGIIDSRYSQPGFFETYHLEILSVIAALAANKILRADSILKKEESERKHLGIFDNIELSLIEVDNDGRISKTYPKFCEMVGYNDKELIGKDYIDLFLVEQYIPVITKHLEDRKKGKASVYEVELKTKNKDKMWVMITGAPIFDKNGSIRGSIGIHHDITAQKNLQTKLDQARKSAEQAKNAETIYLANMSHEIRTPLNAIIGMIHLMEETALDSEQLEYLEIMMNSSDILLSLISDVLDIAKIDAGTLDLQEKEFDLISIIESLRKTFEIKAKEKELVIRSEISDGFENFLIGDPDLLNQILLNLLSNAEKFTMRGEIAISAQVSDDFNDKNKRIRFSVSDTGIGIGKAAIEQIFHNFKQANREIRDTYGGTGLGLAIARKLVHLMGGQLKVESEINKGSNFHFEILLRDSGIKIPENNYSQQAVKSDFTGNKVLIVEDNKINQRYITQLLTRWNIPFDIAGHGLEAVELSKFNRYDIIFMDLQMPLMDGFEATRIIRKLENENSKIPILALTASTFMSKKELALNGGMTDFLSKPFTPDQLQELLGKYLQCKNKIEKKKSNGNFSFPISLDHDYLQETYRGDLEYAKDMFEIFMENTPGMIDDLKEASYERDFNKVKMLAHKMKPTFVMVGLPELNRLMLKIENAAEDVDAKKVEKLIGKTLQDWDNIQEVLLITLNNLKTHVNGNS